MAGQGWSAERAGLAMSGASSDGKAVTDPLVIFTPSGKRGRIPEGTPVLEAARRLGVDLDSVCGGRGICSRCQVSPSFGEFPKHGVSARPEALSGWNEVEDRYHRIRGLPTGRRLGCQARILGDIVVDVPAESQVHRQVVRKSPDERPVAMDPAIKLHYIEVSQPDIHDPSGDLERLREAISDQWGIDDVRVALAIIPQLQGALRVGDWKVTVALHRQDDDSVPRMVGLWPGFQPGPVYGYAVDVGSTTIAAHLCDLETGNIVAASGAMNPQIRFGEDLMSRVSYAMLNEGGATDMTAALHRELESLFEETAASAGVDSGLILETVFVCNPVMHHLLLGLDPTELGQAPFALATADPVMTSAGELGIGFVGAASRIYILPCIAGHVGADCAAVILSEQPHLSDDLVLIVDVGTNAEIVLGNRDRVLACSSPTGPAFEGAQISSGQRAAPGAIERVEILPGTGEPRFKIIGSELWSDEAGFSQVAAGSGITGICGSGIIEAIAELRVAGIIDQSGLAGPASGQDSGRILPEGRTYSYLLHGCTDEDSDRIMVTQADIRAIQLAKAALYAGARLLMDELGVDSVDRIVLAGAFGSHISTRHAMILGMIPDCNPDRVSSAGNAAGTGARMALCSLAARREIEAVVNRIEKVETAMEPRFQEHFVNATAIPHAVDPFPHLEGLLPDKAPGAGGEAEAGRSSRSGRRSRRRTGNRD